MTTDFRALCAELVDYWENDCPVTLAEVMERARAAMAEPEPEGPTDEELLRIFLDARATKMQLQGGLTSSDANGIAKQIDAQTIYGLRAVLARWGHPS